MKEHYSILVSVIFAVSMSFLMAYLWNIGQEKYVVFVLFLYLIDLLHKANQLNQFFNLHRQELESKVEHCDTPDCPECNMKAYNRGRKDVLEETTKYLKDCLGASDPTCYSPDYFEGFNEAIKLLSK